MALELTHWGAHVAFAMKARGVDTLFTLSGSHIWPIYDGCVQAGIRIVDFRHESAAAFAAEGHGRLKRSVGVAAVTAGPGNFNAVNAIASASKNGSPLVVLGGRSGQERWGRGALQEIDHVPVMAPLSKLARTVGPDVLKTVSQGLKQAATPPRGPVFFDFPADLMAEGTPADADETPVKRIEPDPAAVKQIAGLLAKAKKPVLMAGANVYLDSAWESMRALVEAAHIPVLMNGMGRGTLPADHRLAFARARSKAFREADVVLVAGTAMDFRIGFGEGFAADAAVVHLDSAPELITRIRPLAVGLGADLDLTFRALGREVRRSSGEDWIAELRAEEERVAQKAGGEGSSDRTPIHPLRLYAELRKVLARDAVVICDGGDFVSYAGREIASYVPGAWLDPGPFGCLGCWPGYAIAAKLLYPSRQVVLVLGDGAFGFSGMEFDTMVRHKLPVVAVVGNNGIWALEKHPMKGLFGYDVAADLRQETRYDQVVQALGGYGERVTRPGDLAPAFKRAFEAGVPALVNVQIDPEVVYPRSANLM